MKSATAVAVTALTGSKTAWPASGNGQRILRVHNPLASVFDVTGFEYQKNGPGDAEPRDEKNQTSAPQGGALPLLVYAGWNGITWESNGPHAIVTFRDPVIDRRKQQMTSHRLLGSLRNFLRQLARSLTTCLLAACHGDPNAAPAIRIRLDSSLVLWIISTVTYFQAAILCWI